jgi:hypothetical protein
MPSGPPSPDAGGLHPAERRRGVGHDAAVDPDHPGLEAARYPPCPGEVARVDVFDEPALGVVGGGDRLLFVVEGDDRRHRPEDLLVQHAGVARHVDEHRGREELAGSLQRASAGEHPRAAGAGVVDEPRDPAKLLCVDDRPDLDAGIGSATDAQGAPALREAFGELVEPRAVDVEPVGCRAGLPAVAHLGQQRAIDGILEAGVSCARAYGVKDEAEAAGVRLLDEYKGHPSVRQLISEGYEVITF